MLCLYEQPPTFSPYFPLKAGNRERVMKPKGKDLDSRLKMSGMTQGEKGAMRPVL